ncbi:MAG: hypothetical protein COC01_09820 [Bacteroidetes bacterium]|nr:MAG: hypothetical protein COC01_09820 [Bacteroidota bacterium]
MGEYKVLEEEQTLQDLVSDAELFHPELSYKITGILFKAHNELGRYSREIQYCDFIETLLIKYEYDYKREYKLGNSRNRVDFLIENKILIEVKAKDIILKEDYYQTQRYLHSLSLKLGLLVNFRAKYLRPKRIIRIDTINGTRFADPNN